MRANEFIVEAPQWMHKASQGMATGTLATALQKTLHKKVHNLINRVEAAGGEMPKEKISTMVTDILSQMLRVDIDDPVFGNRINATVDAITDDPSLTSRSALHDILKQVVGLAFQLDRRTKPSKKDDEEDSQNDGDSELAVDEPTASERAEAEVIPGESRQPPPDNFAGTKFVDPEEPTTAFVNNDGEYTKWVESDTPGVYEFINTMYKETTIDQIEKVVAIKNIKPSAVRVVKVADGLYKFVTPRKRK